MSQIANRNTDHRDNEKTRGRQLSQQQQQHQETRCFNWERSLDSCRRTLDFAQNTLTDLESTSSPIWTEEKLGTTRFGRSSQKRKRRTTEKKQHLLAAKLFTREQSEMKHNLDNICHTANSRTLRKYRFLPQENISIHLNAKRALGNMHPSDYFEPITKLAFHNLTENNELPNDTNRLLSLGLKFIPTPKLNITQENLDHTFARFDRDIGLRVFFSGDTDDDDYDPSEL